MEGQIMTTIATGRSLVTPTDDESKTALDELTALSQELGLYDDPMK